MNVKLLILDIDGTLTDGKIYIGNNGEEFKAFNIKDGLAIKHVLPKYNITPIVITGRRSKIVENRCAEIGVRYCYQNCSDKIRVLREVANQFGIVKGENEKYSGIAYIGDDVNDIECMYTCDLVGCPADAIDEVKNIADFVSKKDGGYGAVREFIDWIVQSL